MYNFCKRFCDILLSILGIIVTCPIWIITTIGILVSDFGPVFYLPTRIGKNNKSFKLLKFRSMKLNSKTTKENYVPDNERVFAFGKMIRKLKIDELPQLINVLIGDMSLVGPRPVAINQFDVFRGGELENTKLVRPGLTGTGALYDYIYGENFSNEEEYFRQVVPIRRALELVYISKRSCSLDCYLIWQTIVCILCVIFHKQNKKCLEKLLNLLK